MYHIYDICVNPFWPHWLVTYEIPIPFCQLTTQSQIQQARNSSPLFLSNNQGLSKTANWSDLFLAEIDFQRVRRDGKNASWNLAKLFTIPEYPWLDPASHTCWSFPSWMFFFKNNNFKQLHPSNCPSTKTKWLGWWSQHLNLNAHLPQKKTDLIDMMSSTLRLHHGRKLRCHRTAPDFPSFFGNNPTHFSIFLVKHSCLLFQHPPHLGRQLNVIGEFGQGLCLWRKVGVLRVQGKEICITN